MIDQLKIYGVKYLFHFTDKKNLKSIKERGILPYSTLKDLGLFCYRSSSKLSQELDNHYGLDRYVHVCFRPNHPMYYSLMKAREKELIWIGIHLEVLKYKGVLVTKNIANKNNIYPMSIIDADKEMDYKSIFYPSGLEFSENSKAVSKYEILIPQIIPVEMTTLKI